MSSTRYQLNFCFFNPNVFNSFINKICVKIFILLKQLNQTSTLNQKNLIKSYFALIFYCKAQKKLELYHDNILNMCNI